MTKEPDEPDEFPGEFTVWWHANADRLRACPPAEAADEIGDRLTACDERLGVEVAEDRSETDESERELIVTAFSDPALFSLVQRLVCEMSGVAGWEVLALKPARGFSFNIRLGHHTLDVSTLDYVLLSPSGVGIVVPASIHALLPPNDDSDLVWLVLEAGLGEKVAATIRQARFVVGPRGDSRPLACLAAELENASC